jgi:uncharacterized protein YndB with AHSA1/START domain
MNPTENSSNLEIVCTRVIDAPRERVFEAFADPKHLAQWWGPEGFTNTVQEFDFRPGGTWRIVMHGPDGVDYDNVSEFIEVVKPERIVYQHLGPVHPFLMTMIYEEHSGKTKLTWRMRHESAAQYAKLKDFLAKANEQNFDRLEAELKKMKASG